MRLGEYHHSEAVFFSSSGKKEIPLWSDGGNVIFIWYFQAMWREPQDMAGRRIVFAPVFGKGLSSFRR
ncbi:hypothetical protein C5O12_11355 [Akkermansia muciniphila]|jgi:hypothetical protein|nr:hypothetical protein C1O57_11810 [Akkermansia muciniphila]QAA63010.1 hypothetical protein C1O59_11345 [Akkermansia muciniphila]QHV22180.1 hypothetical protein C5O12_11355 [Akkermansia muciniphila]QHV28910.1 hypothetical protein C5O14_11345 [Akkermansia muciniphila]